MAVRKAPGHNRWYLIISQGRNQPQLSISFDGTETEARAAEREIRGVPVSGTVKVVDLVASYLKWYQTNRLPRSYGELSDTMKRLLPHFGNIPAAYLLSNHLESYKDKRLTDTWQGRHTSKITINRELKHLMAMLRWSAAQGTIPPVTLKPEYFSERHCEAEERPIAILSPQEIRDFLTALTGRPTWLIFVLLFWTGIRSSEARNLRVEDVDLLRGVFRLKGKGGKVSSETIPASLVPKLKIVMAGKQRDEFLCPNPRTGKAYTDLRTPMETACKRAGITKRFHPHACRHTFATVMDDSGAGIVEIQMKLRHSDINTTRKYIQRLGSGPTTDYMGVWMSGSKKSE